jgi:Tfp pilus assembly protein PilO
MIKLMQIKADKILKDLENNKYVHLFADFKEEKTRKVTYIVLTLIALSLFGAFAISPTLSTISKLKKELKDNKFVEQQLQKKINDLTILDEKYNLIQSDLPVVYEAIPKNPDVALLAAQIQSLSQQNGLTLTNIQIFSVDSDSGKKDYSLFNFSLSAEGDYNQISNFITSLNSMRRITTERTISITRKDQGNLTLTIKGEAYFKKL